MYRMFTYESGHHSEHEIGLPMILPDANAKQP